MTSPTTTKPLTLNLPPAAKVLYGELYDTLDPAYLTQDILHVELPGGIYIDVSWYPEHEPSGRWHCRVFRGEWENNLADLYTRDIHEAGRFIEEVSGAWAKVYQSCDA